MADNEDEQGLEHEEAEEVEEQVEQDVQEEVEEEEQSEEGEPADNDDESDKFVSGVKEHCRHVAFACTIELWLFFAWTTKVVFLPPFHLFLEGFFQF